MRFEEAYERWNVGRLTQAEAAQLLGLCERSFRRYVVRYEAEGLPGLVDRRLEQVSQRRAPVDEVLAVTDRYQRQHLGWNVRHFHSWYRRDGGQRSYSWVKQRLQETGLVAKCKAKGVHLTQFGRALQQLGIAMIAAYSPEARGRSERAFATHQERLPKELAHAGITDLAAANRYLARRYRPAFNAEFAVPAREEGSAFVPWIGGALDDILCEQVERTVGNDNCVRHDNLFLQLPADRHRCHYVKAKVRVHRYPDGRLAVFHGPRRLADYNAEGKLLKLRVKRAA
jgi:hypothetical protein